MFPKEDVSEAVLHIPESRKSCYLNVKGISWDEFTDLYGNTKDETLVMMWWDNCVRKETYLLKE